MNDLIRQRDSDDCTICSIAMATGLPYERVMSVAAESRGGYRYQGTPGTMSPRGVLLDLGFDAERVMFGGVRGSVVAKLLWGRRAILSVPSLNGFKGHHDVYWNGRQIVDPTQQTAYAPDALNGTIPLFAVLLDELAGGVGTDQANDCTVTSQSPKPDRMERSAISPSPPPPTIRPDTGDA